MEMNERKHLSCRQQGPKGRRLNSPSVAGMGLQKKYARCHAMIVDTIDTILRLAPLTILVSNAKVKKG